ncbi:MAG TPA: heparan-alpha-glucosaminide N-acetyltransferase domain-containing protein [Dongiaceae bacterium]|nr:heparan-alpha-glucosaminide N-acetyltransferase domain-containing protein [Dongiaceae bacterium]
MPAAPSASPSGPSGSAVSSRITSIDALRGSIMILMALDHVRDFTSSAAMQFSPTDLTRTTAALFFTRWITHFCAPVFAFTAGLGAFFWLQRSGRTRAQLSWFLLTRGLWLVLVELTVVRFLFFFQFQLKGGLFVLTVFWMLGLCMVFLAALIYLPPWLLASLSLFVVATHNLFDGVDPARFGAAAPLWDVLHQQALIPLLGANFVTAYPLVPWIAVVALGYCCGPVFRWDAPRRFVFLLRLGSVLTLTFLVLRAANRYGDASRWEHQSKSLFTVLSFLNATKYPPSLLFLLMTLGPALIALALFERFRFADSNPLIVFGRVPFFYFLFHLMLAHLAAIALGALRYGPHFFLLLPPPSFGGPPDQFPPNHGYSLPVVYLIWFAVVALSYPVCRRYASYKSAHRANPWLSYL